MQWMQMVSVMMVEVYMWMMVMMFRHICGNTARHLDLNLSEARSTWAAMNANELFGTRRVWRVMLWAFLAFGRTEGEPAHFDLCLALRCQHQSQTESVVVGVLLVELDDDIQTERSQGRSSKAVLVDMDGNMDCESRIHNGALKVDWGYVRDEILKLLLTLP
jgi:hypothetical protein